LTNAFRSARTGLQTGIFLLLTSVLLAQPQPTYQISRIEFVGEFIQQESLLKKRLGLREKQTVTEADITKALKELENQLSESGCLLAHIDSAVFTDTRSPAGQLLTVFGSSGPQVSFGNLALLSDSIPSETYARTMNSKKNSPYSGKLIEEDIKFILRIAADQGFPFAEISVDDPVIRRDGDKAFADLLIRIREGRKIYCSGVQVSGNSYTRDHVILREISLPPGSLYIKNKIDAIPQKLNRLGFLKNVHPPSIISSSQDSVDVIIRVEEGSATAFDGVIGYIPDRSKTGGYFSGLIDLSFKNLFGTGRLFDIHWKKADRYSEEFYVAYTEPWIFACPVDVGVTLERVVRDTTYLEWNFSLSSRVRLFERVSVFGGFRRSTALPDSAASRELRLARNSVVNGEIGLEYDTRDFPANPASGVFYMSSYTFGRKSNYGPSYLFTEDSLKRSESLNSLKLRLEWYQRLWQNQVFALQLNARQIKGDRLQLTDYFWFGGSRSLRGYRENQFYGSEVAWVNLEYRFLLGRTSRAFLFNDWGFYRQNLPQKIQNTLPGYGFGIRFETPLGVLGIDYGLGKGDSFRDGKIHFGIVNRF